MERPNFIERIENAFSTHSVVALLGPRQCGKTTLARQYIDQISPSAAGAVEGQAPLDHFPRQNYFDLENTIDLARLSTAQLTLGELKNLIVIDEIQRAPELFPTLRVLVDETANKRKFLILGSASPHLIQQSSETLTGRIQYIELTPFSYAETGDLNRVWLRGGFPRAYLAQTNENSYSWRLAYLRTFVEQDIPGFGLQVSPNHLRRFWMMLAHYHGNLFNASELGRSLQLSQKTVRHYLDILVNTFMVRELQPWFENISKRQVKSPKIYFRDSGLFHTLLGVQDLEHLKMHPKLGASWEGMVLEEIIQHNQAENGECYFWSTHGDAELDLLIVKNGKRLGFEIKYTDKPKLSKSMKISLQDLQLDALTLISPGNHDFPLHEKVRACGLDAYLASTRKG
jgi:predicted AAA+ superfamily ATPase